MDTRRGDKKQARPRSGVRLQNKSVTKSSTNRVSAASRKKLLRRLEVLQSASIEGRGPSQLKSFEETDNDQQHRTGRRNRPIEP